MSDRAVIRTARRPSGNWSIAVWALFSAAIFLVFGSFGRAPATARRIEPDVVFFGDSITVGNGASSPYLTFVGILRARLSENHELASDRLVISGFGGISGDQLHSHDVTSLPVGLVVLEVAAHSVIEDANVPMPVFRASYGRLLDCLQATGATVVAGTAPWLNWHGWNVYNGRGDEISRIIREEARARGIPVADIWTAMHERPDVISPDGLHPNDAGHRLIADLYWNEIEKLPVPANGTPVLCTYD